MKVPISELFDFEKGMLQSLKCTPGKYTFITASEDWKTHNEFTHDCEALIFAMAASGSLGRTHYFKGKFISSDLCFILTPTKKYKGKLDLKFYYRIFNSLREDIVKKTKTGTSKQAINRDNFGKYELPYFDYDAQIKNRELFDELSEKKEFLFSELTTQQTLITQLRQSILQEAVQGKLVKQNKNDEPANELLKRIKAEKEKLVKQGNLKKEKPLPPISENEIPYQLPEGWVWCRLGEIVTIKGGKRVPNGYQLLKTETPHIYIRVTDMKNGTISEDDLQYIDENVFQNIKQYTISKDDIYMTIVGATIGKCGLVPERFHNMNLTENAAKLIPYFVHKVFLWNCLKSNFCQEQFIDKTKQVGVQKMALNRLASSLIPLPPLPEQKRIVEKANQLMQHCNELEQQVQQSITHAQQLMQAVLREVFEKKSNTYEEQEEELRMVAEN